MARHLAILKSSGPVHAEKDPEDARWIHYAMDREAVEELKSSLCAFLDTEERPQAL